MSIRVGIVGLAGVGTAHVNLFGAAEGVEIAAVCDINEGVLAEHAAKSGAKPYTSYEAMLAGEQLDAVSLCTPPKLHAPMTEQAAARGLHVLCEKPMAPSITECQRMIDACGAGGVKLMIALKKRFAPMYERIRSFTDGEAGQPTWACARYALGRVEKDWFWAEDDGGGPLLENSVHMIDILRSFMGDVVRVTAEGGTLFMADRAPVADAAAATLKFASGGVASLGIGYGCEWSMARTEVVLATPKMVFELEGSFDRADQLRYCRRDNPGDVVVEMAEEPYGGGFPEEIAHFVDCVANDKAPLADGVVGRESARICLAVKESIRTGKPVVIGE